MDVPNFQDRMASKNLAIHHLFYLNWLRVSLVAYYGACVVAYVVAYAYAYVVCYCFTEGFLTPHSFQSTNLATWRSNWESKEEKFIKEFNFLGFSRCFSIRIEQT